MPTDISPESADSASVGEAAYRRIRSDIVLGRLTPGRRLPLERMKEAYGASVSTLRELFNRLATEGLLVAEGSRGFQVTAVSSANLRDVASMRLLLEGHGLKESFLRGDLEWEGRVVSAHHKLATMEKKMAVNDPYPAETWRQYDWAFHLALISACGSDLLLQTYTSICDKYLRYQMIASIFRGQEAADEHRVLLESALARDWRRAQQTLTTHVDECVTQMASVLDAA
ncbi:Carbon starvation induced regulator [Variovorax sp. PBL-H6]|uniref:GntR family transcriptional regulator n=1 Tax=Variovorax sp. PBL-H6 TaxID=434009 RepID=UPI0013189ADA|nr:GntR family transcriptional regulator [Variovorax sp. PBL-H6]VTU21366.1 Carbon starvation induced regulator [Variovorax sp. PBL-H6]